MSSRLRRFFLTFFYGTTFFFLPVLVLAQDEKQEPEWVLPWFVVLAFLTLGTMALLRATKRADTTFTLEELNEERNAKTKKH